LLNTDFSATRVNPRAKKSSIHYGRIKVSPRLRSSPLSGPSAVKLESGAVNFGVKGPAMPRKPLAFFFAYTKVQRSSFHYISQTLFLVLVLYLAMTLSLHAATDVEAANQQLQILADKPSVTLVAGQQGTVNLTVIPEGDVPLPVSFTCADLPAGASCKFSPVTNLPAEVTLTLSTTTSDAGLWPSTSPHDRIPARATSFTVFLLALALPGLLLLPSFGKKHTATARQGDRTSGRRGIYRQIGFTLAGILLLLVTLSSPGCSAGKKVVVVPLVAQAGNFILTVTASAAGATQGSTTIRVTITE
jgi:hypothetical protein